MACESRTCPPHSVRMSVQSPFTGKDPACPSVILLFAVTWHRDPPPKDLCPWHCMLLPLGLGQPDRGQGTVGEAVLGVWSRAGGSLRPRPRPAPEVLLGSLF